MKKGGDIMNKLKIAKLNHHTKKDPKKIYRFTDECELKEVNILEREVSGDLVSIHIQNKKIAEDTIKIALNKFNAILTNCGIDPIDNLIELADETEQLIIINPKNSYKILETDEYGYIKNVINMKPNYYIKGADIELPKNVNKGYYKINKNVIIKDELRKAKLNQIK